MDIATETGWSLEYIATFDYATITRMARYVHNKRQTHYRNLLTVGEYQALVANGKASKGGKIRKHFDKQTGYNGSGRKSNFAHFLLVHTGGQLFKETK